MNIKKKEQMEKENRKARAKEYGKYIKQFTPKPKYFSNALKAFIVGGLICVFAYWMQGLMMDKGISKETAGTYATLILIVAAQIATGFGIFDLIAKFAGAGVIVPITGFANSMVAPAMEFKKEGVVLGIGSKLFSIAGPVLVYGIATSVIIGIIYWLVG